MKRRHRRPRAAGRPLAIAIACFAVGLAVGWLWHALSRPPAPPPLEALAPPVTPAARGEVKRPRARANPPVRSERSRPRIALVIDDLGRSVADVETLLALDLSLTYSVLPFEPETAAVVKLVRARRAELLCHLPMASAVMGEPLQPGALRPEMSDAELGRATAAALDQVWGAVGVNNHQGSLLTADRRAMAVVMAVLRQRGLYFLDSRTTAQSVAFAAARAAGIPAAERQVFLDDDPAPEAIRAALDRLVELAHERGTAIGIGHPRPSTIAALREAPPVLRAAGVELVPLGALLRE